MTPLMNLSIVKQLKMGKYIQIAFFTSEHRIDSSSPRRNYAKAFRSGGLAPELTIG